MTQPLSLRLPEGIRFFPPPLCPPSHQQPPCEGPTSRGGRRAYHVLRMNHGWFRLCLSAGGPTTATTGEGRHPCTWPRTFWFKPLSAFGLLDLTTFISSSPELAMPSTLAPNRLSALAVVGLSHEKPGHPGWVRLRCPKRLRTARSPLAARLGRVSVVAHWVTSGS